MAFENQRFLLNNSGLERREREKVFMEANGAWDYDLFKEIILLLLYLIDVINTELLLQICDNRLVLRIKIDEITNSSLQLSIGDFIL